MGRYVFVIDDDPALLRLSTLILRLDGHEVEAFMSAREALGKIRDETLRIPDVIVLDVNMPDMGGIEFYGAARTAGFANPVVIVSAYGAESVRQSLGATASLRKPFQPDDLSALICSLA